MKNKVAERDYLGHKGKRNKNGTQFEKRQSQQATYIADVPLSDAFTIYTVNFMNFGQKIHAANQLNEQHTDN